jgi:hypothetical protein
VAVVVVAHGRLVAADFGVKLTQQEQSAQIMQTHILMICMLETLGKTHHYQHSGQAVRLAILADQLLVRAEQAATTTQAQVEAARIVGQAHFRFITAMLVMVETLAITR